MAYLISGESAVLSDKGATIHPIPIPPRKCLSSPLIRSISPVPTTSHRSCPHPTLSPQPFLPIRGVTRSKMWGGHAWRARRLRAYKGRSEGRAPSGIHGQNPWSWGPGAKPGKSGVDMSTPLLDSPKPSEAPFPLQDVDPHLIHQCLGRPHSPF